MQLLAEASNRRARADDRGTTARCAWAIIEGVPPAVWFIRKHMRQNRAGLSIPQFRALMLIARNPSASLGQVAEHLSVSHPSASRLISKLVDRGYVTRSESSSDRRQIELVVTPQGKKVRLSAQDATRRMIANEIAGLKPEQLRTLEQAMRVLGAIFAPEKVER